MIYSAETVEAFRSRLEPSRFFARAEDAERFHGDLAAKMIRSASLDRWDEAVATGEGALAEALRILAPEIPAPAPVSRRRRAA